VGREVGIAAEEREESRGWDDSGLVTIKDTEDTQPVDEEEGFFIGNLKVLLVLENIFNIKFICVRDTGALKRGSGC
jgi:hypothetical protein